MRMEAKGEHRIDVYLNRWIWLDAFQLLIARLHRAFWLGHGVANNYTTDPELPGNSDYPGPWGVPKPL